ncbi:hypothetical protein [Brachybacterium sp. AOP3-A1-3]|uniref:hypothetical protein n=1 Tax=Brachybacterium sp. AOP3-A1-3 TaxID=3457699 RepID=UPI004033A2DE
MADDVLAAMLAAIDKRANDTDLPRMPRNPRSTANINNPMKPTYTRPRRGGPTYRDKTANDAIGNVDSQRKKEKNR